MVPPAATLYLCIAPCTVLTQVSDLAWKANWETEFSSDKQPFHKNTNPPNPKIRVLFRSVSQLVPQQLVSFSPLWSKKEWVWLLFFFFGSHSFPTLVQVISPSYFSFSPACPQVTNSFLTLAMFSPHVQTLLTNSSFYFPTLIIHAHLFPSSCSSFHPVSPSFAASSVPCLVLPTFS